MSIQVVTLNPSLSRSRDSSLILEDVIYTLSKAKITTVAAKLKPLAHRPTEVGAQTQPFAEGGEAPQMFCRL